MPAGRFPQPSPPAEQMQDHVAFWRGVRGRPGSSSSGDQRGVVRGLRALAEVAVDAARASGARRGRARSARSRSGCRAPCGSGRRGSPTRCSRPRRGGRGGRRRRARPRSSSRSKRERSSRVTWVEPDERGRVVDVDVLAHHVQVAGDDERRAAQRDRARRPSPRRSASFWSNVSVPTARPFGHVGGDDADAVDDRLDPARLVDDGLARQAGARLLDRQVVARDDRDARPARRRCGRRRGSRRLRTLDAGTCPRATSSPAGTGPPAGAARGTRARAAGGRSSELTFQVTIFMRQRSDGVSPAADSRWQASPEHSAAMMP